MKILFSLLAVFVVLGVSQPAHAQYSTSPVGVGPTQGFAGVGGIGNNQFIYPNVTSAIENNRRMNLGSTGLWDRITTMSFFKTQYSGYNTNNTQYPEMGMAYLQSFGYRVAQPAK